MLDGDQLATKIKINRPQADRVENETYLIFYTTDDAVLGATTIIHPAKQFAKANSTVPPAIADPIIPHSSVGVIKLTLDVTDIETVGEESYQPEYAKEDKKEEEQFNVDIIKAVEAGDIDKALSLVDKAEKGGSKTARPTFVKAVSKK